MGDPVLLAPAVVQFDFPPDLADRVIEAARGVDWWTRSEVVDEVKVQPVRTSREVSLSVLEGVAGDVEEFAAGCVGDYQSWYQCELTRGEPWTVLQYLPGGLYECHADASWEVYRVASVLVYLNPADYEGGETVFHQFDVSVKPDAPALVMFPSNYAYEHEAMPVLSGEKFVCVTWFSDLPEGLGQDFLSGIVRDLYGTRSAS